MSNGIYSGSDFFLGGHCYNNAKIFPFQKKAKEPSDIQKIHSDEDRQNQC
jgi:hypothetical protein